MKIFVIGSGIASTGDLQKAGSILQAKPSFRKASVNMKLAYLACTSALRESGIETPALSDAAFVLGSSYGELIQTKEFLKACAKEGLARPLLFQSSLHNGTLGFLSLELQTQGPSFTVSHHYLTGEKSMELAMDLLRDCVAEIALVSAVEVMDPDLRPSLLCKMPEGVRWQDGAASLVLVSESWLAKNPRKNAAEIVEISYGHTEAKFSGEYYDSDGIKKFITELLGSRECSGRAEFLKRDGKISQIDWRAP
jgi:hypothetical protein